MAKSKISWQPGKTAAENAKQALPSLANSFFQAGRKVTKTKVPAEALHDFRLTEERFRHHLEMFRPCYGPGLKRRLDVLKKIQNYLGDISDCQTAKRLLSDDAFRRSQEKKSFQELLTARTAKRKKEFARHWREKFDAPGQLDWWTNYLKRYAGVQKQRK